VTRGRTAQLPQRAGSPSLNGGEAASAVPPNSLQNKEVAEWSG